MRRISVLAHIALPLYFELQCVAVTLCVTCTTHINCKIKYTLIIINVHLFTMFTRQVLDKWMETYCAHIPQRPCLVQRLSLTTEARLFEGDVWETIRQARQSVLALGCMVAKDALSQPARAPGRPSALLHVHCRANQKGSICLLYK